MLRLLIVSGLIAAGSLYSLRSAFYALLFYLWIAYFRPELWIWSDALQGVGLSFYVGVYLLASALLRAERLSLDKVGVMMALLCVQSLISTLMSPAEAYAWPYWMDFAKSTVISCLIIVLVNSYDKLRLTLVVIALSLGLEGAKQGWFYLITSPEHANENTVAFLGDNNGVAVGMLMLTPVLLALAQTTTNWYARIGYRLMAVGTTFRALTTYSRGGLLSFAAMCAAYWTRSTRKAASLVFVTVLAAGLLPMLASNYWDRMATMTAAPEDLEDSAASRLHFWRVALVMARDQPIFGVGHNAFSQVYDKYDDTFGIYGTRRAVHSSWLGILSELGIPGFVLFMTIYGISWRRCGRIRKTALRSGDANTATIAGALQTSLVVFAVGGTFLSFQYTEIIWHFFALAAALQRIEDGKGLPGTISETSAPALALAGRSAA